MTELESGLRSEAEAAASLAALEPLAAQLAESDGRLRALESEFQSGLRQTGEKIGSLSDRLAALEPLAGRMW